ncbi:hypothetical protein BG015_002343, partial [Linnemannia schmuckeri]
MKITIELTVLTAIVLVVFVTQAAPLPTPLIDESIATTGLVAKRIPALELVHRVATQVPAM